MRAGTIKDPVSSQHTANDVIVTPGATASSSKADSNASSRERVLESAIEEFASFGYAGARIDRIARRVSLNVRMIYYHFGSKEGLYRAVLQAICWESAVVLERMSDKAGPEATVKDIVGQFFDFLASNVRFADILVREFLDGAAQMKELLKEDPRLAEIVHRPAFRVAENAIRSSTLKDTPPRETLLSILFGALFLVSTRNVHSMFLGHEPGLGSWKNVYTDMVADGLAPRNTGKSPDGVGNGVPTPVRRGTTAPIIA